MITIIFFFTCLMAGITGHRFDSSKMKEDLDIERQLKLINKTPVKSIHTKFGYIVDCIDINKQPAFDHPLLMNHKLQRKPSFQNRIRKTSAKTNSSTKAIFGLKRNQCPTGTVPIRRTTKDHLIRSKSFFNNLIFEQTPGNHVAEVTLIESRPEYFSYYGVSGINSVYNVKVGKDQTSSAMMWIRNGPKESMNLIGIGWHVAPQLYKDDATHLYAVWTDNFKKTGCFNILCSGFVQTSKEIYLGSAFEVTSIYGGDIIEITISITQDSKTKNWWVTNEHEDLGYFPASIFSNLTYGNQVGWGGRTTTSPGAPSPLMGSGYFPDNILNHASSFRYVTYQNESRKDYGPREFMTNEVSDKPNCFGVKYYGNEGREGGEVLQFGGPGGNCGD